MTTFVAVSFSGKVIKETEIFSEMADFAYEHKGEIDFIGAQEPGQEFGEILDMAEFSAPYTIPAYWDCECRTDYVHPKSESVCPRCGATSEDQPDSITAEVVKFGLPLWSA